MTRLALVRHGRTAWNSARLIQGRTDVALDQAGIEQIVASARALSADAFTRIVASPLMRAVESARLIARETGVPLDPNDPALIERDYGLAEGLPVAEAHERWPEGDYPDAEPLDRLGERAGATLRRIAALPGDSIVVSHGAFLRVGLVALTGRPHPRIVNGEVVIVEVDKVGHAIVL